MNASELKSWAYYHDSLFDGFGEWWAGRSPEAVEAWELGLAIPTLEGCKEASRELVIGDISYDGGYTGHLKAIRKRAIEISAASSSATRTTNWAHGEPVYDCPHCHDCGSVVIWHPSVIADAIQGKASQPRTCAMPCSCRRGEGLARAGFNGNTRHREAARFVDGAPCEFLDPISKTMRRAVLAKAILGTDAENLRAIAEIAEIAEAYDAPATQIALPLGGEAPF